jgi:hypothetical protein
LLAEIIRVRSTPHSSEARGQTYPLRTRLFPLTSVYTPPNEMPPAKITAARSSGKA